MNSPLDMRASIAWNALSLGGRQGLRMVAALVLARLLGPEDFGIASQAIVYITLVGLFANVGLTSVVVQRTELSDRYRHAAGWVSLAAGMSAAAVTFIGAPTAARIFGTHELVAVIRVLSVMVILRAVAVVPSALLIRDSRFDALTRAELSGAAAGAATGILAAGLGAGYWALVIQLLVTNAVLTVVTLAASPLQLGRTDNESFRGVLRFGGIVLATNSVNFGSSNGDNLLIAMALGPIPLGFYALSYRVMSMPVQVVGQTIIRTVLPAFSRSQSVPRRVAAIYEKSTRSVSIAVTGPLILVALAAGDAIPWAFGEEWSGAVTPTRWIAIAGILRLVFITEGTLMVSLGRPGLQFWWSGATTTMSVIGFVVGIRWWGINGVAASVALLGPPMGLIGVWLVSRLVPVSMARVLSGLVPALAAGLALVGLWYAVVPFTTLPSVLASLLIRCTIAILGYLAVLLGFGRVRRDARSFFGHSTHGEAAQTDGSV